MNTNGHRRLRYVSPCGPEAESQPGSRGRVPKNLLAITTVRALDHAEYEALVNAQEAFLDRVDSATQFDAATLCDMHKVWLNRLYPWAGQYRTVELQKGDFRWPPAYLVEQNMRAFESGLLNTHTPCRPGDLGQVAQRLAEVHAELLLIHPFRDGNGRLARWLSDLMALQAGLPVPAYLFEGRDKERKRAAYLAAVAHGYVKDYAPLTTFFREALERALESRTCVRRTTPPSRAPSKIED